jgi:hypothetical protein
MPSARIGVAGAAAPPGDVEERGDDIPTLPATLVRQLCPEAFCVGVALAYVRAFRLKRLVLI